jgi:hypothetical protein
MDRSNDLPSNVLRILTYGLQDLGGKDPQQQHHREPKHSPLVMTPGGTFAKAKGRAAFSSPGGDDEDEMEEGEEESEQQLGQRSVDHMDLAEATQQSRATSMDLQSPVESNSQTGGAGTDAGFKGARAGRQWGASKTVGLFGGSITVLLPATFDDISMIRQVPDHQEVFVDRESEISFIVELVNYNGDVTDNNAPKFYFTDLAECNEAKSATIDSASVVRDPHFIPHVADQSCVKCVVTGRQTVTKFRNEDAPLETVQIVLVVVRLPHVGTDMLVTMNVPISATQPPITADRICPSADILGGTDPAAKIMSAALSSLSIKNWSLFC